MSAAKGTVLVTGASRAVGGTPGASAGRPNRI